MCFSHVWVFFCTTALSSSLLIRFSPVSSTSSALGIMYAKLGQLSGRWGRFWVDYSNEPLSRPIGDWLHGASLHKPCGLVQSCRFFSAFVCVRVYRAEMSWPWTVLGPLLSVHELHRTEHRIARAGCVSRSRSSGGRVGTRCWFVSGDWNMTSMSPPCYTVAVDLGVCHLRNFSISFLSSLLEAESSHVKLDKR